MKYIELTIHTTTEASEIISDIMWNYTDYGVTICDRADIIALQTAKESTFWDYMDEELEEKLLTGSVILDIEPNGAFHVREAWPEAVLIFIAPPSMEELERRLRGRGDTSEDQIHLRLSRAQWELEQGQKYDYVVVNDQVEACAEKILNIIAEKAD